MTQHRTGHPGELANPRPVQPLCSGWFIVLLPVLATPANAFQARTQPPSEKTPSCITAGCHTEVRDFAVVHEPVTNDRCMLCHKYDDIEKHTFTFHKPKTEMCMACHRKDYGRTEHTPHAKGECLSCHSPHGSEHEKMLVADPATELCLKCHADDYNGFDYIHGPVSIGACIVCHEPHASSFDHLLTRNPRDLCTDCHASIESDPVLATSVHKPMEDGCINCHNPHASNIRYQLEKSVPELCLSCHQHVEETLEHAEVKHGVVLQVNGCTQCHSPHESAFPHLQKSGQLEMCLSCHDERILTDDGRELPDMKKLLEENESHHGPIRQGGCTVCHGAHAASHFNLLASEYPPEFYAPFEIKRYELCFSCHMPELATKPSGTGYTGFRRGDQNLHYLHVNLEKGRTCRACHEVHASSQPFHIRESVPFGATGWPLEIRFTKTETGGTCSPGCHKTRSYDRSRSPEESDDSNAGMIRDANPDTEHNL